MIKTSHGCRGRVRPLAAGAGALLIAGLVTAPAQAAFPGKNGRIAFERQELPRRALQSLDSFGDSDLLTVSPDGTGRAPLVVDDEGGVGAADPAVSPDGKQVAYVRSGFDDVADTYDVRVHVVGIDGTGDHQAVPGDDSAGAPAWAPDGKRLVYVHEDELRIANADGTGSPTRVSITGFDASASNPQWSPDGRWIAFDDGNAVSVVPAAGGRPIQVSSAEDGTSSHPNWAPDGTAIAYERHGDGSQIVEVPWEDGKPGDPVAIADGSRLERPAYSPDGLKIAWAGYPSETSGPQVRRTLGIYSYTGIVVADADGSHARQISSGATPITAPDWAPVPAAKPPVTQGPPPVVSVTPTGGVKGVTQHQCGSRRNFVIRLRPRGARIAMARVIVDGKRVHARPGRRWTARIDLRTLPKQRLEVDVTVWTKAGERFHETRRYWTCTPAR